MMYGMLHTKGRDAVHSLRYSWSTRTRHSASYFGWLWRGHCLQPAQKAQHVAKREPIAQHSLKAAQPAAAAVTATAAAEASHHANQHFTPTPMPMDPHPTPSPPAAGLPAGTGQDIALAAASDVHDARHASLSPPTPQGGALIRR